MPRGIHLIEPHTSPPLQHRRVRPDNASRVRAPKPQWRKTEHGRPSRSLRCQVLHVRCEVAKSGVPDWLKDRTLRVSFMLGRALR